MPAISALSSGQIGDESFAGVITKTTMDTINGLFFDYSSTKSLKPAYIALGSGETAATQNDTALEHEIARYPLTQLTQANGITTALVNLPITVGDITASEIGVFTADDMLISRSTVSIEKNSSSILNLVWVLTIKED